MDILILEPTRITLATVARALQVCQKNSRNETPKWKSDKVFCSSLQSMLESIIACSPESGYFTHHQELNLLIQVVLQPLYYFQSETIPYMSRLENSWGSFDSRRAVAQLEDTLMDSVIPRLDVLKSQVYKYMEGINTLLLLHVTELLCSDPRGGISEEQATELQHMRQRANVTSSQDLDPLPTMSIDRQQKCLISIRRAAQHHWRAVEMSINGVWSRAAGSNGDDPSAGKGNLDVSNKQGGTGKFSEDKFEANHIDRRQFPIHTAPKSPAHQHLQGLRGQEHDPMRFRTGNLMSNIHDAGNKLGLKGGSPDVAHPGPGIRRKPVGSSREKPLPQPDDTTCAVS